jgi:hypothetical protein
MHGGLIVCIGGAGERLQVEGYASILLFPMNGYKMFTDDKIVRAIPNDKNEIH